MAKLKIKIKIGVIDDHVQTAISLSQLLEFNGFKTFQAYNLKDAIEKTKQEKPDLLILDIQLGYDEEGYEIAKELSNQKILFIASFDYDSKKIKKFRNVIGTLKKPVDNNELLKAVRKEFKISRTKIDIGKIP